MAVKALLQLLNGSHELEQLATPSEDFHGLVGLACGRLWRKGDSLITGGEKQMT